MPTLRVSWIAEHVDSATGQKLATRAFSAVERVCYGKARKVRFKSIGRGLDSIEGRDNESGLHFVWVDLEAEKAKAIRAAKKLGITEDGTVITEPVVATSEEIPTHCTKMFRIPLLINWKDELVDYSLQHRVKFTRILRKKATSKRARGADCKSYHYFIQLVLEGTPYKKQPKAKKARRGKTQIPNKVIPTTEAGISSWAKAAIGLDLGPQTIAIASQDGSIVRLEQFCSELTPDAKAKRRLQRNMVDYFVKTIN